MARKRILFACVGNAFRSQIAEAWARHLSRPEDVEIHSGGTAPSSAIHPMVPSLMSEVGVKLYHARPKAIDLEFAEVADAFVTLCGPMDDACPAHIAKKAIEWDTPDPSWSPIEEMRGTRDRLGERVRRLLGELGVLREGAPAAGPDPVHELVAKAAKLLKITPPKIEYVETLARPRLTTEGVLLVPVSVRRHFEGFDTPPTAFARDVATLLKRREIARTGVSAADAEADVVVFAEVFVRDHVLGAEED